MDTLTQSVSADQMYTPLLENVKTYRHRRPELAENYRILAPAVAMATPSGTYRPEPG